MSSRWPLVDAGGDGRSAGDDRVLSIDPATGVLLLVLTKGLDSVTTAFALAYVPWIEEGNPIVASVFGAIGTIPGLLVLSVVGVVGLVVATEGIAAAVDDGSEGYPELIRLIGYVPASAAFFVIGVQNAVLVATGVPLFGL